MFRSITSTLIFWPMLCSGLEVGYGASMVNFPFVAAIYYKYGNKENNHPFCTGTIIMDTYVLTTAGCMHRTPPDLPGKKMYGVPQSLRVWIGSSFGYILGSSSPEGKLMEVLAVFVPTDEDLRYIIDPDVETQLFNNYTVDGLDYFVLDFALLETKSIIYNRYVHAIPFDPFSLPRALDRWNTTLNVTDEAVATVPDCFIAGWGTYGAGADTRLYKLRYVKVHNIGLIHCLISYCGNCSLCHLRNFNTSLHICYSMYLGGDTCPEDEGAALYCPWFGIKNEKNEGWGAILGVLSGKMGSCRTANLPSMFSLIWTAYPFITRVTKIAWPPPGHEWIVPKGALGEDYEHELI